MDWIINKKRVSDLSLKKRRKVRKNYAKPTLRYCINCKKVWEISTTGSILYYEHLPTYGLDRRICKACNNHKGRTK